MPRRSQLLIVLVCFSQCIAEGQSHAQTDRIVPLQDCTELSVLTSGWSLSIRPDGSGSLGYGSTAVDSVEIPAHSFSFAAVYRRLAILKYDEKSNRIDPHIAFRHRNPGVGYGGRTPDRGAIRKLFQEAKLLAKGFHDTWRLPQLWTEYPPVP